MVVYLYNKSTPFKEAVILPKNSKQNEKKVTHFD
jgi:hypothetical protein